MMTEAHFTGLINALDENSIDNSNKIELFKARLMMDAYQEQIKQTEKLDNIAFVLSDIMHLMRNR